MLDEIQIAVSGGAGGKGAVGFRRERYVPRGGPDGGDGGRGGSVIIEAVTSVLTLDDLRRRRTVRAEAGGNGRSGKQHGRDGKDIVVLVPEGTVVWLDGIEETQLADLREAGQRVVVAKGGSGGRGNARFATSVRQAPRIAEAGLQGGQARLRLELRLLAEAGLVGLPNAGKSSLLQAMSAARPKVGAYPFTTLEPYLGVVEREYERVVVADIPGLIEGAHEGQGLGTAFLQHVKRTRVLIHVVDATAGDVQGDIEVVRHELEAFGHGLAEKRWLIALNKTDLLESDAVAQAAASLRDRGVPVVAVSALARTGVPALIDAVFADVAQARASEAAEPQTAPVVRPAPVREFQVVRLGRGFEVRGERPGRVIARLGLDSEEARAEVARRLRRMGVVAALRKAGVADGDRVRIGREDLKWPL